MLSAEQVAGTGTPGKPSGEIRWHGSQPGKIKLADRALRVQRPRLGHKRDGEVQIPAYEQLRRDRGLRQQMLVALLRGASHAPVRGSAAEDGRSGGMRRSSVSRRGTSSTPDTRPGGGAPSLVASSAARSLRVPRTAGQLSCDECLPSTGSAALLSLARRRSQRQCPGTATACCSSACPSPRSASLTRERNSEINRGYLREELYAGKPHVRICEGEGRMAELLRMSQP